MKKLITITTIALFSIQVIASERALIFATEATYPPFVSMSANNQMQGFDVDIANAVCQQMNRSCQFVNAPWDSLIPSLEIGKYDVLFGGMAITAERAKVVDFTESYYQNSVTFVVNKNHPLTLTDAGLKGKTIGVQRGTTFQTYLKKKYAYNIVIKPYVSNMQALLDLKNGRLDGALMDTPVADNWLKEAGNQDFKMEGQFYNVKYFGPGNAFAVQKGNTQLLNDINNALNTIKANGTYQKIENQYFKN
jgi:arginine transport system substrate-binding protein